jgi:hypothetical protein
LSRLLCWWWWWWRGRWGNHVEGMEWGWIEAERVVGGRWSVGRWVCLGSQQGLEID